MAHFLPKAAIFDLDGTLTDSMYVWDRLPEELVRRFGGIPAPDLSHTLRAMSSPQAIDYLIRTYHLPATPQQLTQAMEAIADREYREKVPLKPGVRPLLERLRQLGIPCCVATASQVHQARQALERLGVWPFFSFVLSATQYGPKTRPDLYLEAARQLGAAAQHTLVFEDALHAAQTAVQAGFQVVGVYDAFSEEDQPALKKICRWHLHQLDDPSFLAQLG